jgi:glycosyltransferase involved in cell wall biosynthesis
MKIGLVKGGGFSPWEAPLYEKLGDFGITPLGICAKSNNFSLIGVKMQLRKLNSFGGIVRIPLLSKVIQWVYPLRDYMFGFNRAVRDLDLLITTENFNIFSKQCVDSGKPTIVCVCDNIPFNIRKRLEYFDNYVRKRAKHFIVTTELGKRMLKLYKVPEEDISIIPHAIDSNIFKPMKKDDALLKRFGLSKSDRVILFIGELEPIKGAEYLIYAFNEILKDRKDVKLLIIGKGRLEGKLKEIVRKLGIDKEVIFGGSYPYNVIPKIHNLADVLCLPSITNPGSLFGPAANEKFGYVLIEAMACEKPIVTTSSGGIPLVVEDKKTAFVVPPTNWGALREKIEYLLDNPAIMSKMGRAGRLKVLKEYDLSPVASGLAKICKKVLSKKD